MARMVDKVALVVGGAKGIGLAVAERLAVIGFQSQYSIAKRAIRPAESGCHHASYVPGLALNR